MTARGAIHESGKNERKQLYQLVLERRRPLPTKDTEAPLYLLSREFLTDWRTFLR